MQPDHMRTMLSPQLLHHPHPTVHTCRNNDCDNFPISLGLSTKAVQTGTISFTW